MGKLHVKNGTPVGNDHLCKGCSHGQFMSGYRESDVVVLCGNLYPAFRLPFVVHECSDFEDRFRPDWQQMEKLAIEIQPVRVSKKTRGFDLPNALQPEKPELEPAAAKGDDEDQDEFEDVDAVAECVLTP
jgi:hypothetical protein